MTLEELRIALMDAHFASPYLDMLLKIALLGEDEKKYAPRYTESIDSAATLVPGGLHWSCGGYVGDVPRAYAKFHEINLMRYAATPALSLCLCRVEYELMSAAFAEDPTPKATHSSERGWMN